MPARRSALAALGALGAGAVLRVDRAGASPAALQVFRPKIEALPAVPLLTMRREPRRLDRELDNRVPLVLNFVFTTCSSSCSVQTALLAELQRRQRGPLQLASITIDPDNDTPEQLQRFSRSFGIGAGWQFYTGGFDDLVRVQRHFDVYRGSKASHPPVLLLRREARAPWLRVEGFPALPELAALVDALPA